MTGATTFGGDDRAVTPVIGAILLFAIATIAFSTYQATVVPDQNNQVEFEHHDTVIDEMTDVRSAVYQAKTTGDRQSRTVTLGDSYPSRTLAMNPPPISGTLETEDAFVMQMEDQSGDRIYFNDTFSGVPNETAAQTRILKYEPSYNEFDSVPIYYENTVLYQDYRETGNDAVVLESGAQQLFDDEQVTLIPLQGEFSASGSDRTTVEPIPGLIDSTTFEEDVNITLPTKLDQETWEELIEESGFEGSVSVDDGEQEIYDEVTITVPDGHEVEFARIGIDEEEPMAGERGEGSDDINPAAPGQIALLGSEQQQYDDQWNLTFQNTGDSNNFTEGRINFYPGEATEVEEIRTEENTWDVDWEVGDHFRDIEPGIHLEGDDDGPDPTTDVTMDFDSVSGDDEWFVVTFILETGEEATYFVGEEEAQEAASIDVLEEEETNGIEEDELVFDVYNTHDQSVDVTDIQINDDYGFEEEGLNAGGEEDEEVEIDDNGEISVDGIIEFDEEYELDEDATIEEDSTSQVILSADDNEVFDEFHDDDVEFENPDDGILTVILYYEDDEGNNGISEFGIDVEQDGPPDHARPPGTMGYWSLG